MKKSILTIFGVSFFLTLFSNEAYLGGINGGYAMYKINNAVVGLPESNLNDISISVYPNPAFVDESIFLSFPVKFKSDFINFKVKDITGKVIFQSSEKIENEKICFNLKNADLRSGYYIIALNIDSVYYYVKLMIIEN